MSDVKNEVKKIETAVLLQNIVKLVPVEIIALFAIIKGIIPVGTDPVAVWVTFTILAVLVPLYVVFAMKVKNVSQVILMTLAFPIWVFALGGLPLETLTWYAPWMMSVGLALFTLIPPMFYGQRVSVEDVVATAPVVGTASKTESVVPAKSWREV